MALQDRLMRIENRLRRSSSKGDERHHLIDEELAEFARVRADLVTGFNARLAQIEANTGRIDTLEAQIAAHIADKKGHK